MTAARESRRVVVRQTAERAVELAAEMFNSIICETAEQRGQCHIALSGGTTPHPLYELLARQASTYNVTPWQRVQVWFVDERDVPHDSVESNYGLAQRSLLDAVPVSPSQIHPMSGDAPDLQQAAREYEQSLRDNVPADGSGLPRFDLMLLGMGADGHTASIFPGTEAVAETDRLVMSYFVPVLGRTRMTLTFPVINAGRNLLMLVTGGDKADAVAALLQGRHQYAREIPAARVDPSDGLLYLILDAKAARHTRHEPE